MTVGGDPDEIRDEARRLRGLATEIEPEIAVVRRSEGVQWHSVSADRFRDRMREHARDMDDARLEVLEAAAALDRLADALTERQRAIRAAMNAVHDLLDGARRTVAGIIDSGAEALSEAEKAAERLLENPPALPVLGDPRWVDLAKKLGA